MAEASINELLREVSYEPPESDVKRQKLIEFVLTGNSKQYLGKAYTEEQINELGAEEVDKQLRSEDFGTDGKVCRQIDYQDVFVGSLCRLRN